jgi:hypothetical protein
LLPLTALHRLVLVLELVEFELEEVGQVVRSCGTTTTAAALLALTHLDLVPLLGFL